jgi:hypothetical protein
VHLLFFAPSSFLSKRTIYPGASSDPQFVERMRFFRAIGKHPDAEVNAICSCKIPEEPDKSDLQDSRRIVRFANGGKTSLDLPNIVRQSISSTLESHAWPMLEVIALRAK